MPNHYTFDTITIVQGRCCITVARKLLSSLDNIKKGTTEIISGDAKGINHLVESMNMKNRHAETSIQILKIFFIILKIIF